MLCNSCKEELPAKAKFCPSCGEGQIVTSASDQPAATKTEGVRQYAKEVVQEASDLSKTALKSDLGKKMAAGAALGAVIAVPVPFVGPAVGAVVGAGIVAFRRMTK